MISKNITATENMQYILDLPLNRIRPGGLVVAKRQLCNGKNDSH